MRQTIVIAITVILDLLFCTKNVFASSDIVINEFLANPPSGQNEWVELYNPTGNNINLSEWTLSDQANNTKNLTDLGIISAGGFTIYEYPGGDGWLNNTASSSNPESITIKNNDGNTIDSYTYTVNQNENNSSGRIPDGTDNWTTFMSITKGSPNISTSTPAPTPTSTPSITPTPSSTPQSTSSFIISNIPSQINSDQSFPVTVNLSLTDNPNTKFFLKGALRHPDKPTNYFGLTKVGSTWVKNGMTATSQLQITTDQNGNWTDKIEVQPDSLDSGFIGTGDYFFKVARYDQDGGNLTWSNEVTIKINDIGNVSSNSPSPQSIPKVNSSTSIAKLQSFAPKPTPSITSSYQIASVAGAQTATPEGKVEIKNQKQTNPFVWVGLIFIFAGAGAIGYIYLKKNANIRIPFGR